MRKLFNLFIFFALFYIDIYGIETEKIRFQAFASEANDIYIVEVTSYLNKKNVLNRVSFLKGRGYPADFIKLKASENGKINWYVVHFGYYADKKKAENAAEKYKFDFPNRSYIIKSYSSDFFKKSVGVFQSQDKTSDEIISDIEIWADAVESKTEKIKKDIDF
ncbi:MAG: SPOR domain-containing protein [Deltaproteobacteria bacterium]|nr:SPOR domain-containing protein [Deltaproteobacteria bacterium]